MRRSSPVSMIRVSKPHERFRMSLFSGFADPPSRRPALAQRFTVVTTLERSRVLIDNLIQRYGMGGRAKVRASDIAVLELEDAGSGAIGKLAGGNRTGAR